MIIPARSSRRASQPLFWRTFPLDWAVSPPSPRSTPPKNTTKWVFQSKKNAEKKPACWRMHRLDWTSRTVISRFNPPPHLPQNTHIGALGRPTGLAGPGLVAPRAIGCVDLMNLGKLLTRRYRIGVLEHHPIEPQGHQPDCAQHYIWCGFWCNLWNTTSPSRRASNQTAII